MTRNPIPDEIFESWNVQIHVVGTDNESDGESTTSSEVINLLSSMVDLRIGTSGIVTVLHFVFAQVTYSY